MKSVLLYISLSSLFLFVSCDWVAHKFKIQMEMEDVVIEAAKEELELSKELAEKEIK